MDINNLIKRKTITIYVHILRFPITFSILLYTLNFSFKLSNILNVEYSYYIVNTMAHT